MPHSGGSSRARFDSGINVIDNSEDAMECETCGAEVGGNDRIYVLKYNGVKFGQWPEYICPECLEAREPARIVAIIKDGKLVDQLSVREDA